MIDVSQFQGTIDWPSVPTGTRVLIQCTHGTAEDPRASENLARALAQPHLRVGPYHFQENGNPAGEIARFLAVSGAPSRFQLRGMIDVEPSDFSHPTKAGVEQAVAAYLKAADFYPTIYGTHDVLAGLRLSSELAKCPLMLAGYGPNDGREHDPGPPPPPWTHLDAHQYTSVGAIPGVNGHVDLSSVPKGSHVDLPHPRPVIDKWKVSYVAKSGGRTHRWTRAPMLFLHARPTAKYRGAVHIYPHRKESK